MKIKIKITGMGWKFDIPAEKENGKVIIDENRFAEMLGTLSYTQDVISGGFRWEFEEKKRMSRDECRWCAFFDKTGYCNVYRKPVTEIYADECRAFEAVGEEVE